MFYYDQFNISKLICKKVYQPRYNFVVFVKGVFLVCSSEDLFELQPQQLLFLYFGMSLSFAEDCGPCLSMRQLVLRQQFVNDLPSVSGRCYSEKVTLLETTHQYFYCYYYCCCCCYYSSFCLLLCISLLHIIIPLIMSRRRRQRATITFHQEQSRNQLK